MRARRYLPLVALALLAACGTDPEPEAVPQPTRTTASPSPSPTVSYDPAWLTTFYTEDGPGVPGTDRTYTFQVAGAGAGQRLRPGMWSTFGGTCDYTAGKDTGRIFKVDAEGWEKIPAEVRLEPGATFVVKHLAGFRNGGCGWIWDRKLD